VVRSTMLPIVDSAKPRGPEPEVVTQGTISSDFCRKHCHYPALPMGGHSEGEMMNGCPCMEENKECDFQWDETGRGFCNNCHHGSSLTVKASDCTLSY
jgi:hypothetical protein